MKPRRVFSHSGRSNKRQPAQKGLTGKAKVKRGVTFASQSAKHSTCCTLCFCKTVTYASTSGKSFAKRRRKFWKFSLRFVSIFTICTICKKKNELKGFISQLKSFKRVQVAEDTEWCRSFDTRGRKRVRRCCSGVIYALPQFPFSLAWLGARMSTTECTIGPSPALSVQLERDK